MTELQLTSEQVLALLPLIPAQIQTKVLTDADKMTIINSLFKRSDIFESIQLTGWKMVGQWLVYGHESVLGFQGGVELCAQLETIYKRYKRSKDANKSILNLRAAYVFHVLRLRFPDTSV